MAHKKAKMPTVILLDVSLSMSRPVQTPDTEESHTRLSLGFAAINAFLDYLHAHAKLEYVSLVAFSSLYEVVVPFTRDYDSIRSKMQHIEEGDKTCIEQALHGINHLVLNEWGYQTPVQIIFVTDGSCGVGSIGRSRIIASLPLPPPYPARIHVLPIAAAHDSSLTHAMPLYQKMVELASATSSSPTISMLSRGAVYCPEQLTVAGVCSIITRLCEQQYGEVLCGLRCGQLGTRVRLFPAPQPAVDDAGVRLHLNPDISVIGFISQHDLGTPVVISKHLIIPQPQVGGNNERRDSFNGKPITKEAETSTEEENNLDPSKVPNFCVLLHGALKVENMSAIVILADRWYGAISAWCEPSRTRRSCLLLSAMAPGPSPAPWLGPMPQLGPDAAGDPFPVRACRSYSGGGGAAWSRPHALLADVQKVLRHARKLPDKTQQLYKELNRLRRSAISLGFSELLTSVGAALERECASLPNGSPAECAIQLAHAAAALRDVRTALDIKHTLQPLSHNFVPPTS